MRPPDIVVGDPGGDLGAGVIEIEEQGLVEQLIPHPAIKALKPFCIGFPGAMKCQSMAVSLLQASMALQVNSVPWSDTIMPGLPRRATMAVSSRATRRPEIDVSGMAPKHSLVTSSTMLRMRKRRPLANWSWTKSNDQRAFGFASTRIGTRAPTALRRARRLRTVSPSSR